MENIVDLAMRLIKQNGAISAKDIVEEITNPEILLMDKKKIEALIYNDLMIDGKFILVDGKWDLSEKYTMKEILHEQYRSFGEAEIVASSEQEEDFDINKEEIEMAVDLGLSYDEEKNDVALEKIDKLGE